MIAKYGVLAEAIDEGLLNRDRRRRGFEADSAFTMTIKEDPRIAKWPL